MPSLRVAVLTLALLSLSGCAQTEHRRADALAARPEGPPANGDKEEEAPQAADPAPPVQHAAFEQLQQPPAVVQQAQAPRPGGPSLLPPPESGAATPPEEVAPPQEVVLADVLDSVWVNFPLVRAAYASRQVAAGEALAAMGAFDHKVKADSRSEPLGFYENYRQSLGVERATMWGGRVFGGYRIGRGDFEPWYQERATNGGGEFKLGVAAPLARNRNIDAFRSELWQANVARGRVEPEIQETLIPFFRDAAAVYWQWVAAAENVRIAQSLIDIARERDAGLARQVETGDRAEIDLTDNQRLIVSREADAIDARRKLQQAEVKLSLFLRDADGAPRLANAPLETVAFPELQPLATRALEQDIGAALGARPETVVLDMTARELSVALRQARNLALPEVNVELAGSQDVGEPTSVKRDKSPFELNAALTLAVPLERRKALGEARALRGKLAQVNAKRRFAADKIVADVRAARAALEAAHQRVQKARESVRLAVRMREAEGRAFELGDSNLLNLNLREQQAADAQKTLVAAQLEYHVARADYAAALAFPFADPSTLGDYAAVRALEGPCPPE